MKRLLAILCTLALVLSVINPAIFAAENSSLQAAMDDDFSEIIVLEEDTSDLTVNRDTYLDLNGHNLDGVTVTGGTLYCLDSQTADYTVSDGVYGKVTNATGAVKAAEGYLQVGDSFHAVNLDIYAMTLRASDVGVYYKSNFAADEVVAAQVESFGVALSVVTAPSEANLETYCGYSEFTGFEAGEGANATGTSTLLKGIMKAANGDKKNAQNAAMPVYGRAYIKTADGYVFGETVKRSLQQQAEAIDGVWENLSEAQKAPVLGMLEAYAPVMENWNIPNIQGIQVPGVDTEIEMPIEVATENGIVTEAVTVEQAGVSVTVPAGTKLAEGAEALTLTVTPKEESDTGIELEKNQVLMPMDVHVEGLAADNAQPLTIHLGKVMAENLNMGNYTVYHVENGKANEMVLIPVEAEFTAHNQYKYTLDGELTLYVANFSEFAVVSEEAKWEGNWDYAWFTKNPAADVFYIRNADQLAGFGAIVGGMAKDENGAYIYTTTIGEDTIHSFSFAGKTVMLTADISINDLSADDERKASDGSNLVFYPIGYYNDTESYVKQSGVAVNSWFKPFEGTFDGNGNTISDFYQNTWEMFGDYNDGYSGTPNYYREGMGLFGKVYGGTVRNLNVRNFSCDSEHGTSGVIASYADCGATFENIAIFGCNPRVYNIGNGGIVGCAGWYARETAAKQVTFRNITVDNSNKISALWDASGTSAGGILGQYYPTSGQSAYNYPANPGVHFEDCRISAILEVNNDCCSNYHYYWYRYTGMLMGSVRANRKDATTGYTMADTTGITAEGCEVSFGYWNEFWYCELVKNTIASYTHDHQFSRLTSITDLSEITADGGKTWLKQGDFALLDKDRDCMDCYHIFKDSNGNLYRHFHDKGDETNGNEPYETVNGVQMLKEDRQRYLLPFNQILTGDGMGILANREFPGVTVVNKDEEGIRTSQEKFVAKDSFKTGGGEVKLSEIFAVKDDTTISVGSVQAYISPVGEDSTVKPAACVISNGNWEDGILNIEGYGAAKITITDYWYCTPTTLYLTVKSFTDELTFLEDGKTAYCPSCEKYVEWIEVTNENKGTLANADGAPYFGEQMPAGHHHFYLSNDVTYEETAHSFIYSGKSGNKKTICFHLNGHNLTATKKAVAQIGIASELNMMGTGDVRGNNQKPENATSWLTRTGSTIVANGNDLNDPGTVRLYSGTYYQQEGNGQESTVSTVQFGATLEIYDDVTINALDGKYSLYVDTSNGGDGNPETVTIYGGTFNNAVMVRRCSTTTTSLTQLQICGGIFNQGVAINVENMLVLTLSGAPKILGAGLQLPDMITANTDHKEGKKRSLTIQLDELKEGAQIAVSATKDQPFTVTNENADKYSQYFYSLADGYGIQAENGQLICKALTYADNLEFRPDGTAWCMACKANVAWEDVSNVPETFEEANAHYHYYVPENMTLTTSNSYHFRIVGTETQNNQVCLHLNGKTLTLTKPIYNALSSTLNIMGGGEIVGAAGKPMFQAYISTINLYGGTYKAGSNGEIINAERINAKVNLYEDAKIQGRFTMETGKLWLNDTATMSDLNIAGGLATFCDGWTGTVNLTVAESLLTDGVVSTSNAIVESAADGTITSSMGDVTVDAETGAITITAASAEE